VAGKKKGKKLFKKSLGENINRNGTNSPELEERKAYSLKEQEIIERRLRDLGYL